MTFCKIIPTVNNNESKLFTELTSHFKSRDLATMIWGATQTNSFKLRHKDLKLDENGEPLMSEVIDSLDLNDLLESINPEYAIKEKFNIIDEDNKDIIFNNVSDAISKAIQINNENTEYAATINILGNKEYSINVDTTTAFSEQSKRELSFKSLLNNELVSILNEAGFTFRINDSLDYNGIFNPLFIDNTVDGLKTIIEIKDGKLGEEAFPEEFSHVFIRGLSQEPLVQRILNSLNEDIIEEILGSEYENYKKKYNNDIFLLKEEAAGKMLAYNLKSKFNSYQGNLFSRLWNFIKLKLKNLTASRIQKAIDKINNDLDNLSESILDRTAITKLNLDSIKKGKALYQTTTKLNEIAKLLQDAIKLKSKNLEMLLSKTNDATIQNNESVRVKALQQRLAQHEYALGCIDFIKQGIEDTNDIVEQLKELKNISELMSSVKSLSRSRQQAQLLRTLENYFNKYYDVITEMSILDSTLAKSEDTNNDHLDSAQLATIISEASKLKRNIDILKEDYKKIRFSVLYDFYRMYYTEDKMLNVGKNAGNALSLLEVLKRANSDSGMLDSYINSLADASDPLLNLIHKVTLYKQIERDNIILSTAKEIQKLELELKNAGIKDTKFMYEFNSKGQPTGMLLSPYDFGKFFAARKKEALKYKNASYIETKLAMDRWDRENFQEVPILDENGVATNNFMTVPISKYLKKENPVLKLSPEQKKYYSAMIALKTVLESYFPERYRDTYRAVQMSNSTLEAIIDNSKSPTEAAKTILTKIGESFLAKEDDTLYGEKEKGNIKLDLTGNPVKKVPIFFTSKLEESNRLSLDFSSTMQAYSAMALNYKEMNSIVDIIELTFSLIAEREIKMNKGDKALKDVYNILGVTYSTDYTINGEHTNTAKLLRNFIDINYYNKIKKEAGTFKVGDKNIDMTKVVESFKQYTSILGLGLNLFAGISNVTVGTVQYLIESIAGEYFKGVDLANSNKWFWKDIFQYMGEVPNAIKESKLALLSEKFDATQDYYEDLKRAGYYKSALSRIFGKSTWFFFNSLGEFYLHNKTMLAMLSNYKVLLNGDKISIYDAYEVIKHKDSNGKILSTEIKLKEGVTKEDGSTFTNNDFVKLKSQIHEVNRLLNGGYSQIDKGAAHKYILGSLFMQFKQWMPAFYMRRFQSAKYNQILEKEIQGYYMSFGKFMLNLVKDVSKGQLNFIASYKSLNDVQKANIKRSLTEIAVLTAISLVIRALGPLKDRDDTWLTKMTDYQLRRMKLEIGASTPTLGMLKNLTALVKDPIASTGSLTNVLNVLDWSNWFDEIQAGRYKGQYKVQRDFKQIFPGYRQINRIIDLPNESYIFANFADK